MPEPIRSALLEGANWWAEAFDDAGFIDYFRAELAPIEAIDSARLCLNYEFNLIVIWQTTFSKPVHAEPVEAYSRNVRNGNGFVRNHTALAFGGLKARTDLSGKIQPYSGRINSERCANAIEL